MSFHKDLVTNDIHIIYFISYPDAATREADTSLAVTDEGKVARQTDNDTFWVLLDSTGPVWQNFSGGDTTFLQHADTPSTYVGQAGKSAIVNSGETALEFGTDPLGSRVQTTGLLAGGLITPNTSTTLDISAGNGIQVDYSDPENPVVTNVSWSASIGYTPVNLATDGTFFIGFDNTGSIVEVAVPALTTQNDRDLIIVGGFVALSSAIIRTLDAPVNLGYNGLFTFKDFAIDVIGPANVNGNIISANGANLSLNNTGGTTFIVAANFRDDKEIPDELIIPVGSPISFLRIFRAASPSKEILRDPGLFTVINPTQFDDGTGVLQTVSTNDFTVQVVYIDALKGYFVAYGQEVFNSIGDAETALLNGALQFEEFPVPATAVRRSFLVVRNNATDLTDSSQAKFFADAKFRIGGATTTGSVPGVTAPGGADGDVQFNDGGLFGGSSNFNWDDTTLAIIGNLTVSLLINGARIERDNGNIYIGADLPALIGSSNTVLGPDAFEAIANAGVDENVVIGNSAGGALVGATNSDDNVLIGALAADAMLNGNQHTVIGSNAMGGAIDDSFRNTILGSGSAPVLAGSSSSRNVFLGGLVAPLQTSGLNNIFIGDSCGGVITSGNSNIMMGFNLDAPAAATSNFLNIGDLIFGDLSNQFVTIGGGLSKPVGPETLRIVGDVVSTGKGTFSEVIVEGDLANENIYLGDALPGTIGTENIILGYGNASTVSASTTENVCIGTNVGPTLPVSTLRNVLIGTDILTALTASSARNVVIGSIPAASLTTCDDNVIIADNAITAATTLSTNTIIGNNAATSATSLIRNVILGNGASSATSLTRNVIIGDQAALTTTSIQDSLILGDGAATPSGTLSHFLNLGNVIFGDIANQFVTIGGAGGKPVGPEIVRVEGDVVVTGDITIDVDANITGNILLTGTLNEINLDGDSANNNLFVGEPLPGTIGNANTVIGYDDATTVGATVAANTLLGNTVGPTLPGGSERNVLIGTQILTALTLDSDHNIVIGRVPATSVANCDENIILGDIVATAASTLTENVLIGNNAGIAATNLSQNVIIGDKAAQLPTSLTGSIVIGQTAETPSGGVSDFLNIGDLIFGNLDAGIIEIGGSISKPIAETLKVNGTFRATGDVMGATLNITGTGSISTITFEGDLTKDNLYIGVNASIPGTIGDDNIAIGDQVLDSINSISAQNNTGLGARCLTAVTSGSDNVAIGLACLSALTTGSEQVAIGRSAGALAVTADNGVYIGNRAGDSMTGNQNTVIGSNVSQNFTTGANNVFIGYLAADQFSNGSDNIVIGSQADLPSGGINNFLNIGNAFFGDLSEKSFRMGGGETGGFTTDAQLTLNANNKAFLANRLTTTQRDALTAVNGMLIYNTTTNRFEGRENGSWVDL